MGAITLQPETLSDLWHLEKIIDQGDLVRSRTVRKTTIKRGSEIKEGDRKPVTLTIKTEKVELHKDSNVLRITGTIEEAPDDFQLHSHHTLNIDPWSRLMITKEWKKYHLDRIEKSKVKQPLIFICVIDRDGADFAGLRETLIDYHGSKTFRKKKDEEKRDAFYNEIIDVLEKQEKYRYIIIAGPGFEKENLFDYIKKKDAKLAEKIFIENASTTGEAGINEVIRNAASKVLREATVSRETAFVEKLLEEINKDGMIVYGKKETENAVSQGAVETLLVSDEKVKDFEKIMQLAEKMRGNVVIISSSHESGEKFLSLGGIAGFLRYKV